MTTPTDRHIRLTRPVTGAEELEAVRAVLESGMLAQGRMVERFEGLVAERCGSRHAVATSSCTTALHLALVALGIGAGDEVAVADFTFPATANVVAQQGAKVVPVDIDPATYAMDPADLERRISPRTRAIIVVDPVGSPANHAAIAQIARGRGVPVIDDAACAIGGRSCGAQIGSNAFSAITCFSFHARKVITTGEGGMITTNDDAAAALCRTLRAHGGVRDGGVMRFDHAGFNYRLSDLQAAVGVVQMGRLDGILADRRRLALGLNERLTPLAARLGVQLPADPPWGPHLFQSFVVMLPERIDRDAVIGELAIRGVEATIGTYAVHAEPVYAALSGTKPGDRPASWRARRSCLTLPLHPFLTGDDLDAIAGAFDDSLRAQGAS